MDKKQAASAVAGSGHAPPIHMDTNRKHKSEWRKKCKEYARLLEDDFDFDWWHIISLLRYKLQRTRRQLAIGYNANRREVCREIEDVENLIWKVLEYDYDGEASASFYKKHGKPKVVSKPIPGQPHLMSMEFIYPNGKPATKAMCKQLINNYNKAFNMKKADLKKAFDIMLEKIWGWWD